MASETLSERPCVLIVDDEPDVLTSLQGLLEVEIDEIEVLGAKSGPEGLKILEDHSVSLIISDYKMPGMDGLEFLRRVAKHHPGIPSIMITAYPDAKLAAEAIRDVGVGLFVAKPLDMDYFVSVVQAVLTNKRQPTE